MNTINTSREIPATVEEVFAAFSDPARLARWWGPAGFTNTFNTCEFKTGGRWSFTMHGPDGKNYPNESVFKEVRPPNRVVIDHIVEPKFVLTIELKPSDKGTVVSWSGTFENEKFVTNSRQFLETANTQNLDRLTAEVAGG